MRTLFNRGEINEDQFKKLRPQNAMVARAHALPKIYKSYTHLSPFRPIVDTTSSCYYDVGSFLTELLTPLTHKEFVLKDSFDAAAKICNIPPQLFDNGYILTSFGVTSLFKNVPLNRTVNIILDRVYNENLVNTNIRKRTLKKQIKDTCSKTVITTNKKLYQQIDGVSMGSSLGPLLANIIKTELEGKIIKLFIDDKTLCFTVAMLITL